MKIAIIGAGAMGSVYAAFLAEAGNEVWAIDLWREHVDAINQQGLKISGVSGERTVNGINASTDIAAAHSCELVVIATKASGVASVAGSLQGRLRDDALNHEDDSHDVHKAMCVLRKSLYESQCYATPDHGRRTHKTRAKEKLRNVC